MRYAHEISTWVARFSLPWSAPPLDFSSHHYHRLVGTAGRCSGLTILQRRSSSLRYASARSGICSSRPGPGAPRPCARADLARLGDGARGAWRLRCSIPGCAEWNGVVAELPVEGTLRQSSISLTLPPPRYAATRVEARAPRRERHERGLPWRWGACERRMRAWHSSSKPNINSRTSHPPAL